MTFFAKYWQQWKPLNAHRKGEIIYINIQKKSWSEKFPKWVQFNWGWPFKTAIDLISRDHKHVIHVESGIVLKHKNRINRLSSVNYLKPLGPPSWRKSEINLIPERSDSLTTVNNTLERKFYFMIFNNLFKLKNICNIFWYFHTADLV